MASVLRFKDENDAVLQGNDTTYGLAAAVWTKDISRAHAVARRLRAGTVLGQLLSGDGPLSPFGGYKQSGFGREPGKAMPSHHDRAKSTLFIQASGSLRDLYEQPWISYGVFTGMCLY